MRVRQSIGWWIAAAVAAATACRDNDGPHVYRKFNGSKAKVASITVLKFALEAYPQWAAQHPSDRCPHSLSDLTPYMNNDDTKDPWGNAYVMLCGGAAPAGAKGFGVVSYGEDGKPGGTGGDADLNSWDQQ